MLRSFGALLLLSGFAILSARADSIALSDARALRVRPGGPRILETRTVSFPLSWAAAGNQRREDISRRHSQFCGRPCSPVGNSFGRIPGTATLRRGQFVPVSGSREVDFLSWLSNFVRRELGGRVSHKSCKAAGNCSTTRNL
jgi:hypothetical protein